jgi:hypothetical protein
MLLDYYVIFYCYVYDVSYSHLKWSIIFIITQLYCAIHLGPIKGWGGLHWRWHSTFVVGDENWRHYLVVAGCGGGVGGGPGGRGIWERKGVGAYGRERRK